LLTLPWRGVDSNFQYAEAVKLGCRRFFLLRLLGTGRRGSEGIALNNAPQEAVDRIEEHNRALTGSRNTIGH
jgi:hypothetical protein